MYTLSVTCPSTIFLHLFISHYIFLYYIQPLRNGSEHHDLRQNVSYKSNSRTRNTNWDPDRNHNHNHNGSDSEEDAETTRRATKKRKLTKKKSRGSKHDHLDRNSSFDEKRNRSSKSSKKGGARGGPSTSKRVRLTRWQLRHKLHQRGDHKYQNWCADNEDAWNTIRDRGRDQNKDSCPYEPFRHPTRGVIRSRWITDKWQCPSDWIFTTPGSKTDVYDMNGYMIMEPCEGHSSLIRYKCAHGCSRPLSKVAVKPHILGHRVVGKCLGPGIQVVYTHSISDFIKL